MWLKRFGKELFFVVALVGFIIASAYWVRTNVNITLIEYAPVDNGTIIEFPFSGDTEVSSGETVSKLVQVQNEGYNAVWVRIQVVQTVTDKNGASLDASAVTLVLGDDWMQGDDGYYYYTKDLRSGEITTPLWEDITFDDDAIAGYQEVTATIKIVEQGVSTFHNTIPTGGDVADIDAWSSL